MLPLAAVVVLVIAVVFLTAGSTFVAYRYLPAQRARRAACRAAARTPSVFDDLEKADPPTRKVQVREGRIVSWHSAINPIKGLVRLHTPKPQSSRPDSTVSVAPTVDLEKEIQSFRRNYARAKELEAKNPGAGAQVNGIQALPELRAPSPAFRPKILSSIDEADNPADMIKESSWEAYNGHRRSDHPLSSHLGNLSPTLEKELSLAVPQRPAPVKANSSMVVPAANKDHEQSSRPVPRRANTEGLQEGQSSLPIQPLRLDTLNLSSLFSNLPKTDEGKSPTSAQSAIFKSPLSEIVPAAPRPRKPSKLDLRASYSQVDYGFPSPPASSTLNSPLSPVRAANPPAGAPSHPDSAEIDCSASIIELLQQNDFMDLESVMSTPTRASRPLSTSSRATTYSTKSRASSYRVRKRPPPLPINEPVPALPGKGARNSNDVDSPTIPSPTFSEVVSIRSFKQHRVGKRATGKPVVTSKYSGVAVPTFPASPVFRVPLYAGKNSGAPKMKVVSPKGIAPPSSDESEPRSSDDTVVRKSVVGQLSPLAESDGDVRNMLRSATDLAQSISHVSNGTATKHSSASRDVIAAASKRPNPGRSMSHAQTQVLKHSHPGLRTMQRNASAPCVQKALPPLPPKSPSEQRASLPERHERSSNGSSTSRSSAGLSAHPVSKKPSPKLVTDSAVLEPKKNRRISPPSATIISPASITLTSPDMLTTAPTSRTGTATSPKPKTRPSLTTRRSGLDRIAGAVSEVRSPGATKPAIMSPTTKKGKMMSPASLAAEIFPAATLAAKLNAPVVTSREVAPSPRSSDGGSSRAGSRGGNSPEIPPPPPVPHCRPASPAISAVSTNVTPVKRRPPKLPIASTRRWETESTVSPLSVDFPAAVKV